MRQALPVPRLAGPRTFLRVWQPQDAATLAAVWGDPVISARLDVPRPADEATALRWIRQRERAWATGCSMDLAAVDKASDTLIGEVGLSQLDHTRKAALIGWWIRADWRGHRRAGEIVGLVVEWALGEGGLEAVMAEIDADNTASIAVARRAGLRQVVRPDSTEALSQNTSARLLFAATRSQTSEP